jgi:hypothetical protein
MPKASMMCWLLGVSSAQRVLSHGHWHVQSNLDEISGKELTQAASKGLLKQMSVPSHGMILMHPQGTFLWHTVS